MIQCYTVSGHLEDEANSRLFSQVNVKLIIWEQKKQNHSSSVPARFTFTFTFTVHSDFDSDPDSDLDSYQSDSDSD